MTFKQVVGRGGYVRKGERSTPIVFWKWLEKEDEEETSKKISLLRYYSVFNLEQTEGIPTTESEEAHNNHQLLQALEQVIKNMPLRPEIRFGGNRAYYSPAHVYIQLPHLSSFDSPEEYYCTKFHELIHSKRLGRKSILEPGYFGSHEYSKEELITEMGAAFLCGYTETEQNTLENSAAYIAGWLRELKNNKTLLVHAAAQAQKAADFILNRKECEQTDDKELAA